jgi:hypothetical protein
VPGKGVWAQISQRRILKPLLCGRFVEVSMLITQIWNDEAGFIISAELVLVATIVVIGLIVGLVSVRNQVVEELVDVGQAIGALSQSYCFGGIYKSCMAMTDGTCFTDVVDFCQQTSSQQAFGTPGGITIECPSSTMCPQNGESGAVANY